MVDEIYKDFFTDYQTQRVMNASEVWRNFSSAELARDERREKQAQEEKEQAENQLKSDLEAFKAKVAGNPKLRDYLKKIAGILKNQPELRAEVDSNFVAGLELLDLEQE